MDRWSIIAICLVVAAVLFLVTAAVVSSLRMSRPHVRSLLSAGIVAFPIAAACVLIRSRAWLDSPWTLISDIISYVAGLIAAYALIAAASVVIRRGMRTAINQIQRHVFGTHAQ